MLGGEEMKCPEAWLCLSALGSASEFAAEAGTPDPSH